MSAVKRTTDYLQGEWQSKREEKLRLLPGRCLGEESAWESCSILDEHASGIDAEKLVNVRGDTAQESVGSGVKRAPVYLTACHPFAANLPLHLN